MARILTSLALFALAAAVPPAAAQTVSDLAEKTHIHGLAFDRTDPQKLFVATHHGLFLASPDGTVTRISETTDDFMGFTPHPTDGAVLFASGHPAAGGNLGFIMSSDGGRGWQQLSPGDGGPVDFHQLTVAPSDPSRLYGVFGGIQTSKDGGATWSIVADAPEKLIDLAVAASDPETLYAATETGLLVSRDGAKSWEDLLPGAPVTTVETASDGSVLVYVLGKGLRRALEPALDFSAPAGMAPGGSFLLHLEADPADTSHLIAVVGRGVIVQSRDGGTSWTPYGRQPG